MAGPYYVRSGAGGAGTGADWTNAFTTLVAAFAAMVAGDTAYVAHDHAETQASAMTLTSPGTAASPCKVICGSTAGSVPPVSADLATTGTISTTGANALTFGAGYTYYYGLAFSAGSGVVNSGLVISGAGLHYFKSCKTAKLGTNAAVAAITVGAVTPSAYFEVIFDNTTVQFGSTGDRIAVRGKFKWINTPSAIAGATFPAFLFGTSNALATVALIEGVDLSALTSNGLVAVADAGNSFVFKHCKLGSGFVVSGTQTLPGGGNVKIIACDSGDTNYKTEMHASYLGVQTTETTIVHSGGASDATTPVSWKIVTTANPERHMPFECLPIAIWNETTGSAITVTLEGVWDAGAVPNSDDIWINVEYLGTSGFPLGNFASSAPADVLAAGTALASSSVTWTTTGLATPVKFKMSVTITPQEKGPITVRIRAGAASKTFYVDPKITVT